MRLVGGSVVLAAGGASVGCAPSMPEAATQPWRAPEAQVAVLRDGLPDDVSLRIARGIRVEAACLMCHGDNIAPPIAGRLASLYPDDRATGFLEGDLRGLVWVEVPAAKEPTP